MCEVYEKPEERLQPKILIRGLRDHHPLSMIHQIIMHHEYFPVFVDKKWLFLEDNTVTHHLFLRGDKYYVWMHGSPHILSSNVQSSILSMSIDSGLVNQHNASSSDNPASGNVSTYFQGDNKRWRTDRWKRKDKKNEIILRFFSGKNFNAMFLWMTEYDLPLGCSVGICRSPQWE